MHHEAVLLELLLSGFFAIACFRARGGGISTVAAKPLDFLRLTDRVERLRRSRWQWFSMVLVVIFARLQSGVPLVVELTVALQLIVFCALPAEKRQGGPARERGIRRKYPARLTPGHVNNR